MTRQRYYVANARNGLEGFIFAWKENNFGEVTSLIDQGLDKFNNLYGAFKTAQPNPNYFNINSHIYFPKYGHQDIPKMTSALYLKVFVIKKLRAGYPTLLPLAIGRGRYDFPLLWPAARSSLSLTNLQQFKQIW